MTIQEVNTLISPERNALLQHPLYNKIKTIDNLRAFMEGHVYAVWDFMSLLKALQQKLTCTTTPWFASPYAQTRYLINEIVLAEESDLAIDGQRLSHFEMYLDAMTTAEANTTTISTLIDKLKGGTPIFEAIATMNLDEGVKDFLNFTFKTIEAGKPHEIAAAFTFGREDLIPDMFTEILRGFQQNFPETDLSKLVYYFERHIELDGDEHGPMAMQMITELCGEDQQKWQDVIAVSKEALKKRYGLWNAIEKNIR
ncbi:MULTISPECIES: DUF3050 domain-containing protein [Myroides]|uniref:DUF3050 domain-containing protein n=1 Tax=Myroides albus TaxID=2562892 RepID=A0A6I3LG50_9FLAO|nr:MULTISPECIES: DUF3050 domain-containing protein [Myroides]MTG96784.1 DUF3050 domain-containing protein [Myroides albus]MVX36168.1 DUF3050 domain-containing protein [Myroides sp. LoEW2-1]UVD80805.1 DUF3050 domain-containing protein [Myroides albus]